MKSIAILLAAALLSSPRPAPQVTLPSACWKVTVKACTSCAESGFMDSECKSDNNGPYSACIKDANICSNSAHCDADQGNGECD